MKRKTNRMRRVFSAILAGTLVFSSAPVTAQELFGSEAAEQTVQEMQAEVFTDSEDVSEDDTQLGDGSSGNDAEILQEFQDNESFSEFRSDGIRYIKGRPLTAEEKEEQLAPFKELTPIDAGIEVESDLGNGTAAYAGRAGVYPSYYDAREAGLVTSVKNQHPFGTCWAFGMASILETSLLSQGKGIYDLSEEHLSYFFSHRQDDPLGNTALDQNYVTGDYHKIGGNNNLASIFLTTRSGMTTESDVPFPTDASHTQDLTVPISDSKAYNAAVYLRNASFSQYSVERMKELLLNDHAVSVMLNMGTTYYNADTGAYCYPIKTGINHIVTIVGWDDTYSSENFLAASNVTTDGAWIAKNSWGDAWGDEGYFYLSYEDKTIGNLVSAQAEVASELRYPNNYFYDGSSSLTSVAIKPGQSVAAIYQATARSGKAETLGEINLVSMTDHAYYEIQVYTNLTDPADPTSGEAAYITPVVYEQPIAGVQTIEIPEVSLLQGKRYSVVVTNGGTDSIKMGVEYSTSYNTASGSKWFVSDAYIGKDQTFFKGAAADAKWEDCISYKWSFRIKAHTRTQSKAGKLDMVNFQVKASNSGYNLVTWDSVSGADKYYVYRRSASKGGWSKIATVDASILKWKDSKVTANASYRYTVRAYYSYDGKNYLSDYVQGDVIKAAPATQKVSSVKAQSNGIRIRWSAQKNCDGYRIYRKKKGGSYELIKTISSGTSSTYLDKTAKKGVSYYYAVRAYVKEPYGKVYSQYQRSSAVKRK